MHYELSTEDGIGYVTCVDERGEAYDVTSAPLSELESAIREYADSGAGMSEADAERLIGEAIGYSE